jgi:hypothetical protein
LTRHTLPCHKFLPASISALGLAEGRALIRNKRVWQTGSRQRSSMEFRRLHDLIRNNSLGKLTRYECGNPSGMGIQKHVPEERIAGLIEKLPAHLDWRTWCGPAGELTFHAMRHPWNRRWHDRFGGDVIDNPEQAEHPRLGARFTQ